MSYATPPSLLFLVEYHVQHFHIFPSFLRDHYSDNTTSRMRNQTHIPQQFSHSVNTMPTSSSHHTNSLPRCLESMEEFTYAVYTFGDDKIPFRIKLKGKSITLKHFKDSIQKKGNFK